MEQQRIEIVVPEPHYSLLDTTRGDLPEVLVVNDALGGFAHADIFPWHLCITLEARELVDNRMPSQEESELLFRLGDEIEGVILGGRTAHDAANALFLARSTFDGVRELLYQVHDPEVAHVALQALLEGREWERPWEYRMEHDPAWPVAAELFELLASATSRDD